MGQPWHWHIHLVLLQVDLVMKGIYYIDMHLHSLEKTVIMCCNAHIIIHTRSHTNHLWKEPNLELEPIKEAGPLSDKFQEQIAN